MRPGAVCDGTTDLRHREARIEAEGTRQTQSVELANAVMPMLTYHVTVWKDLASKARATKNNPYIVDQTEACTL